MSFHDLQTCYLTGQMSEAQLHQHMIESPMFRRWIEAREARK